MGNYTREEILQMVEEEDVEFIRLQFTDMFGAIKNIAVTARELPRALDSRCMINGEQVAGMDMEKGSDLYLSPILDTFAILPWRPQQGKVARMICDLYFPDGTPYKNSPRYILENVAGKAQEEGYTCYIDPECEFFLFHTDDNGVPTTLTHEKAGYLDITTVQMTQKTTPGIYSVNELTFQGHEFLSNISSQKVFDKTKKICQGLGSASLEVVAQVASNVLSSLINPKMFF